MVFSSIIFLCFFLPIMLIGYYCIPKKLKNLWLLCGSLFFYAFGEPIYILIMLASIIGNYCFGLLISNCEAKHNIILKRISLTITILFNLGILFYFKYFNLFIDTVNAVFNRHILYDTVALPIGISFYTFQGMSYVIDVYRQDGKLDEKGNRIELVQRNPLNLALYISMFPQLIAGPIVRYTDIKDSLETRRLDINMLALGIERFIVGLAKKAILANSLGEVADRIFSSQLDYMGAPVAWLGAILYTLQIYFDFSGYSDMAIGLGKMFGFEFCENFNYPYISKSISEFWRRWHISLSTWFRDYLYIPLGGNRKGNAYINLLIVFLATGIWHGAAWGFLVWGLWHGLFRVIERYCEKNLKLSQAKNKIPGVIKWVYTMLVVILGWVLFKLEELPKTIEYVKTMFGLNNNGYVEFDLRYYLDNKMIFILIIAILVSIPWAEVLPRRIAGRIAGFVQAGENTTAGVIRRVLLIVLLVVCFMFIVNSTYNPFIYFRF